MTDDRQRVFLPDPPPPAGLVYILNFPFVCLFVCPTRFLHDRVAESKKVKDAGTAKKLPKSGPEHHETSPAPFVFMWLSGSGMWHSVDDGTGSTPARPPRTGPFGSGTVTTRGRLFQNVNRTLD